MRNSVLLAEVRGEFRAIHERIDRLGERLDGRIDSVNTRLDAVIDAVAQLRQDFAQHTHD